MSAPLYTSVGGQIVRISSLASEIGSQNGPCSTNDTNAVKAASSGSTILAESFQFSPQSGKFEPNGDRITLPMEGGPLALLSLAKITESRTGLRIPCVVVEQEVPKKIVLNVAGKSATIPKKYKVSLVFLLLRKKKLLLHSFFTVKFSLKSVKLFVRDGPILCWENEGVYYTGARETVNQTKVVVRKLSWNHEPNSMKWFGVIKGDGVVMGTQQSTNQQHPPGELVFGLSHRWKLFNFPSPVHKTGKPKAPKPKAPMPHEYANIVNCLHICQGGISQSGSSFFQNSDHSTDEGSLLALAATSQCQLVEACGGRVRQVCNLTFKDACEIAVAIVTGGEELILVQSASGKICAVWRKSFEVAREWTGFHTVLVDDFLFCGSEQVLLLGEGASAPQKNFRLTDLGTCNWSSEENEIGSTRQSAVCGDNLQSAVQALESQIQTGMAALRSLESQCALKSQLIQQSQDALHNMSERKSPLPSPGTPLTCLCDLSGKDSGDVIENGNQDTNVTVRCLSAWQRVADDHWIIGVEVENQTTRPVFGVHISLIPASSPQTSLRSSISTCSSKSAASAPVTSVSGEPAAKRLKLDQESRTAGLEPGAKTMLVGAIDIPEFSAGPIVACTVVLNWSEKFLQSRNDLTSDGAMAGPVTTDTDGFVSRWSACGRASLHASDVANGKLIINPLDLTKSATEHQRDVQALAALQLATPLLLTSHHSNLGCVSDILKGSLGFQDSAAFAGMMSVTGALSMTRVKIVFRNGPNKMGITVWNRNQSQLLHFCQCLYQLLPADVIIQPLPPANQILSAMKTTIAAMEKELLQHQLAITSLSTVRGHHSSPISSSGSSAGPSSEDRLSQVRGDFEGERRRWNDSDTNLEVCASDEALILRQKLLDLQLKTDTEACSLANAFPVAK